MYEDCQEGVDKYYSRLTLDFYANKRVCEEIAIFPNKNLFNKIAGFVFNIPVMNGLLVNLWVRVNRQF